MPGYHDVAGHPPAELLPRRVIFRFDTPPFFANARTSREQVHALARAEPAPNWIVVAAEPTTDMDTTAADMLHNRDVDLNDDGVHPVFTELKDPARHKIDRTS